MSDTSTSSTPSLAPATAANKPPRTPWLQTLRQSGVDISELKIEGHASSEGPPGASPERAYLYNLDLSQRRAQNALRVCLNAVENAPVQAWARDHLTAVGYSSNRLGPRTATPRAG
jgi:outer membrane protein OmpA-like peptidoglycan-associated protein